MKSNPERVTALQKCERQFSCALSSFLSEYPNVNRWIIAHSGGLDSQVLLHIASRYLPGSSLLVLHVNHHLQELSDEWADFSQCQSHSLSLQHQTVDVFPENHSENAARQARYAAFEALIEPNDCLLMGHHADDQAETVLFRMLRGSGLAGMSGIVSSRTLGKGHLLRPLLHLSRDELEAVCRARDLAFIDDPSNINEQYDRNFLRHRVMPALKERWPNMLERWQKNAQLVSEANQLLESYLESDLVTLSDEARISLDIDGLLEFDERKRSALLRHWLYKNTQVRVNQNQLDTVISDVLLAQLDANPIYQIAEYDLRRYLGALYVTKRKLVGICLQETPLGGPGEYSLTGGLLTLVSASSGIKSSSNLVVRYRQGGERCRPHGRQHSITVKKLLQEASIPPWLRGHWPLLYWGDELVAVPGICICEGWYSEKSGFSLLWRPF